MSNTVKVIDSQSNTILYEVAMDEAHKAYTFASQMELIGVEVTIDAPAVTETLANSLGVKKEDQEELKCDIENEIDAH